MLPSYEFILKTENGKYISGVEYDNTLRFDKSSLKLISNKVRKVSTNMKNAHVFKVFKSQQRTSIANGISEFIGEEVTIINLWERRYKKMKREFKIKVEVDYYNDNSNLSISHIQSYDLTNQDSINKLSKLITHVINNDLYYEVTNIKSTKDWAKCDEYTSLNNVLEVSTRLLTLSDEDYEKFVTIAKEEIYEVMDILEFELA